MLFCCGAPLILTHLSLWSETLPSLPLILLMTRLPLLEFNGCGSVASASALANLLVGVSIFVATKIGVCLISCCNVIGLRWYSFSYGPLSFSLAFGHRAGCSRIFPWFLCSWFLISLKFFIIVVNLVHDVFCCYVARVGVCVYGFPVPASRPVMCYPLRECVYWILAVSLCCPFSVCLLASSICACGLC